MRTGSGLYAVAYNTGSSLKHGSNRVGILLRWNNPRAFFPPRLTNIHHLVNVVSRWSTQPNASTMEAAKNQAAQQTGPAVRVRNRRVPIQHGPGSGGARDLLLTELK